METHRGKYRVLLKCMNEYLDEAIPHLERAYSTDEKAISFKVAAQKIEEGVKRINVIATHNMSFQIAEYSEFDGDYIRRAKAVRDLLINALSLVEQQECDMFWQHVYEIKYQSYDLIDVIKLWKQNPAIMMPA